ncbi:DnaJ domain-containing protein [Mollicutes bacterium LVI A0039]|nr:DnaJ domain-containing protein [Mollicutes bacterium LVI A0039]
MKSYYESLGISNNADAVTIKKAYRELVKKYHPDIYKGEDRDTKFQEIQKAYDVLSDEEKRAAYDRAGHQSYEQSQKYGSGGFGSSYQDFSGFNNFNNYTKTVKFGDMPLIQKILMFLALAVIAVIVIVGFIVTTIIRVIFSLIEQILKRRG